jgi:hypothetical protein
MGPLDISQESSCGCIFWSAASKLPQSKAASSRAVQIAYILADPPTALAGARRFILALQEIWQATKHHLSRRILIRELIE